MRSEDNAVSATPQANSTAIAAVDAEGQPKIAFETAVYDFGEVGPGTKQGGRFEFVNNGDAPLKITRVQPCCGTVTKLADDKDIYAPGERGAVELRFSAPARAGSIARHIYVNSNDPENPRMELTLKARTVLRVDYEPKTVQLSAVEGQAPHPTLTIRSADGKPFSVASLNSSGRCITAELNPAEESTSFTLPLAVDARKLEGRTRGYISIMLTHPECDRLLIPFVVQQKYRAVPAQLVLFNTIPEQAVTRNVFIVGDGDPNFAVDSVESEKNLVKVVKQEKTEKARRLEVEVTPPPIEDKRSVYSDVLHVHVDGHDVVVNVRGVYAAVQPGTPQVKAK